jgi:hypothetical protein
MILTKRNVVRSNSLANTISVPPSRVRSRWPVATSRVAALKSNLRIGRAEALQRSEVSMVTTGKDLYEAHPAFWAPFVLAGEGETAL